MSERVAAPTGVLWDVGASVGTYYALRLAGADERSALLAATTLAVARILWVAWRRRRVTWFAAVMLAVFGLGLLWTFVAGDARALLLRDPVVTAGVGTVFLLSAAARRPLTLAAAKASRPGRAEALETLHRGRPDVRRRFLVSALVWGVGLLAAAVGHVVLVSTLPIDVMVGLGELIQWGTIGLLMTWNVVYTIPMWREIDAPRATADGSTGATTSG